MTIQIRNSEQEKPGNKLQLLLVGAEKSGKSELACTAPPPVLFMEYDRRVDSLSGKKGVSAFGFSDPANTVMQPTAFNESLDKLGELEKSLDLNKLGFKVPTGTNVATLVIDSVQTLAKAASNYCLYTNPGDLAKCVSLGGQTYRVPKNWTAWGSEMAMVESLILRAAALPVNIIVILHEAKEEAEDSTEDSPRYTGQITVFPVRYRILLKYFNEVWRLTRASAGPPTIQFNPDGSFTKASSALRINGVQSPDIKSILQSVNGKAASWTPAATPQLQPITASAPTVAQQMIQQAQNK